MENILKIIIGKYYKNKKFITRGIIIDINKNLIFIDKLLNKRLEILVKILKKNFK